MKNKIERIIERIYQIGGSDEATFFVCGFNVAALIAILLH